MESLYSHLSAIEEQLKRIADELEYLSNKGVSRQEWPYKTITFIYLYSYIEYKRR